MGLINREDPTKEPKYDYVTPLEIELDICSNYLHCTHETWINLSNEEKTKWILYEEKKRKREELKDRKHRLQSDTAKVAQTTKKKSIRNYR